MDHILLSDAPARPAAEPALWADWGRDFYAAVSWSDIPKRDGRRLWLGWMSNWNTPTTCPPHRGGNHPGQTCVNLIVGGQVVHTATAFDSDVMKWAGWEVAPWKGQSAQIQIADDFTGFWGRIYVDHILFSQT